MIHRVKCTEIKEGPDKGLISVAIVCDKATSEMILNGFVKVVQYSQPFGGIGPIIKEHINLWNSMKPKVRV